MSFTTGKGENNPDVHVNVPPIRAPRPKAATRLENNQPPSIPRFSDAMNTANTANPFEQGHVTPETPLTARYVPVLRKHDHDNKIDEKEETGHIGKTG